MKNSEKDAQNAVAEETWHLVQRLREGWANYCDKLLVKMSTPAGTVERDSKIRADLKKRRRTKYSTRGSA